MQGNSSTGTPAESQWQLLSLQQASLSESFGSCAISYQSQFGIESSQANQPLSPSQKSGIYINHNMNNEQSIQIQDNDSTAADEHLTCSQTEPFSFAGVGTQAYNNGYPYEGQGYAGGIVSVSEFQRQLKSCQEILRLLDQFLTGSDQLPYTAPYPSVQNPFLNAPGMAEERNDIALGNVNPLSCGWPDFNIDSKAKDERSIQPDSRQENHFGPSLTTYPGGFPHTSYASGVQTPIIDTTGRANEQNNVAFEQDSSLSQDRADCQQQFQISSGQNGYSQNTNSQVLPRLFIPPSGTAGPSTSTTAQSAQSPMDSAALPHLTAEVNPRTVGSPRVRQAAARRRKKDGIHKCKIDNCNSTFTEYHNLGYHINAHKRLKPYECTECDYASASPATLKRHSKKRHQIV